MNRTRLSAIVALLALGTFTVWAPIVSAQAQNGTTLTVVTTVTPHFNHTFAWTISKSATPNTWELFRGDSGTSQYTVSVTKDAGTDTATFDGTICVTNGGAEATQNLVISGELRDGVPPPNDLITTFPVDSSANPIIGPGQTACYPYSVTVGDPFVHPGGPYKITGNATITNHSSFLNTPNTTSNTASTTLPLTPTLVNDSITVSDSVQGSLGTFSASGSTSYTRTFTCDADQGTHPNTATISPASAAANPSASASVTVNCHALTVTKTAQTSFTRTFKWSINKSVTPATWELFRGDSGTSQYTVSVTKDAGTDSDFAASGTITVSNPAGSPTATINSASDVVSTAIPGSVTCGTTTFPTTLAAGGTLSCTYTASLPDATSRTNTATATLQNHSFNSSGTPTSTGTTGFTGTAAVTFGAPTTVVNDSISVNDSVQGPLGIFSATGNATYSRTFSCDADQGAHPNTATISPASAAATPSSSASVMVNCHALTVTKTAQTSFTRTFKWTINKSANPTALTLATGATGSASYSVTVNATSADSNFAASGTITVSNPVGSPTATINGASDVVSTAIPGSVTCGTTTFPTTLAAGGTLSCTYTASLPDATSRTNTATATLQNHSFNSSGTPTSTGTTGFTGTAAVDFSTATIMEVDKSITVSDPVFGTTPLGTATFGVDTLPKTFPAYSQTIGPYTTCGDKTVTNTASFVGSSGGTGSSSATVTASVQCKLTVTKALVPTTDTGLFNLLIDSIVKASNVGNGGTTGAQQVALGSHTVSETAGTGTSLSDYISKVNCGAGDVSGTSTTVSFASGDSDKTCTITNTKKGRTTVLKTTDGVVNPTRSINFTLTGPGLPAGGVTLNTFGVQSGVLDFGFALVPGSQYTVCENPVPAGFTSFWKLDSVIVTPFNPNMTDSPPQDLGVRCYTFSASAGQTRSFVIDNSHPGGGPRTIGYWKNWNKCTGGNQAVTAAKNGGAAAGFFILDDLLPQTIGNFTISTCAQAVNVLSKQDQAGTNMSNDAAYALAAQLLAAKLNLAAGAQTCGAVQSAVVSAQSLLVSINFTGSGTYLVKASTNRTNALNLATTLANYNLGTLC